MKFIDLFCGIGGFRIGFESADMECVFSCDFDKNVQEVYESNYGEKPYSDITQLNPKDIPNFEILLAGFPCQPFSISGKKGGFNDTRGTLFFDVCRIIDERKPKVVVLENVKHLIHHDSKRTFGVILQTLKELGYNVTYRLLNAKDFGLPQNRERIFIVAALDGFFDFDLMNNKISEPLKHFLDEEKNFEYLDPSEYTLLDDDIFRVQEKSGLIFRGYRNKNGFKSGVRPGTLHLNRSHRQPNRIYSIDGYHPTIPSQESSGRFFIFNPDTKKVRKLSVSECYRIMGFPENFKRCSKLGHQYRQIGNSVSVNITKELSKQILEQGLLSNEPQRKIVGDLFPMY
jgi:DNA (cytosine-5)-methyltransferase 1